MTKRDPVEYNKALLINGSNTHVYMAASAIFRAALQQPMPYKVFTSEIKCTMNLMATQLEAYRAPEILDESKILYPVEEIRDLALEVIEFLNKRKLTYFLY